MSFVARRFGSAGLVPIDERTRCPAPTESGVSLRSPVLLVVGVDDETARLTRAFAAQVDVRFVRVAHGIAASRTIRDARPTVVAYESSLWRDEKAAIVDAAEDIGAKVIELAGDLPKETTAMLLVRAAMNESLEATA